MSQIPWCDSDSKSVQPSGIYAYSDRIRGWAQQPFTRDDRNYLQAQCEKLYAPLPGRKRWDREGYQQFFDLTQPTDNALRHLAHMPVVLINYGEFALDWVFDFEDECDHANDFLSQYVVKRWHRASQGIRYVKGVTRYTAGRHATTNLVSYGDQPSRITGEPACLHIEFRVRGQRTLQRIGISSAKDLVNYDHREFWKQRLIMRTVDLDRFGKLYNRHLLGKGPRTGAWEQRVMGLTYNYDRRTGYTLIRICESTQALLDEFRNRLDMRTCVVDVNVEHLLPERRICVTRAENNFFVPQRVSGARIHLSPYIIGTQTPSSS